MKRIPNSDTGRREAARLAARNRRIAKAVIVVFGLTTVIVWGFAFYGSQ